jgi:hypothetical protein
MLTCMDAHRDCYSIQDFGVHEVHAPLHGTATTAAVPAYINANNNRDDCTYSRIISRRYPDGVDASQANSGSSGSSGSAISPLFEMAVEVNPQHSDYDNTLLLTIDQVEVVMSPTGMSDDLTYCCSQITKCPSIILLYMRSQCFHASAVRVHCVKNVSAFMRVDFIVLSISCGI